MSASKIRAFTLLEMVVALGILSIVLVSLFEISSTALISQNYARTLTVATLLARSKMADFEQHLQDNGFPTTDEEHSGDFSEEGWADYAWKVEVLAPKPEDLSPEQLLAAFSGLPLDQNLDAGSLLSNFMPSGTAASSSMSAFGPLLAPLQTQFAQMVQTLTRQVREIRLTVEWPYRGKQESFEVKTHVLAQGMAGMPPAATAPAGAAPNARNPRGPGR